MCAASSKSLRDQIGTYQLAINSAKTLQDLRQRGRHCARLRRPGGSLSTTGSGSDPGDHQLLPAGAVRQPLAGPLSYRDEVLFKPPEWLRQWWVKRNAIYICDIGQELESLEYSYPPGETPFPRRLTPGRAGRLSSLCKIDGSALFLSGWSHPDAGEPANAFKRVAFQPPG